MKHTTNEPLNIAHCPSCGAPSHPTESDEQGRCMPCMEAAGAPTPLVIRDRADLPPGILGRIAWASLQEHGKYTCTVAGERRHYVLALDAEGASL